MYALYIQMKKHIYIYIYIYLTYAYFCLKHNRVQNPNVLRARHVALQDSNYNVDLDFRTDLRPLRSNTNYKFADSLMGRRREYGQTPKTNTRSSEFEPSRFFNAEGGFP